MRIKIADRIRQKVPKKCLKGTKCTFLPTNTCFYYYMQVINLRYVYDMFTLNILIELLGKLSLRNCLFIEFVYEQVLLNIQTINSIYEKRKINL